MQTHSLNNVYNILFYTVDEIEILKLKIKNQKNKEEKWELRWLEICNWNDLCNL